MTVNDLMKVTLTTLLCIAGLFLLWMLRDVVLLAFGSVVVAILLLAATDPIRQRLRLGQPLSVLIVCFLILVVLGGLVLLIGNQFYSQLGELLIQLPQGIRSLEAKWGFELAGENAPGTTWLGYKLEDLIRRALSVGQTTVGAVASLVFVMVGALFLAADPELYANGFVKLFPKNLHGKIRIGLRECGVALRLWLLGELIAMSIVGVLVGLGAWMIGLPAPLALGLFAGLAELIPILGPIIAAGLALVLASTQGIAAVLWTLALFVAVQQIEANVLTPLLQRKLVDIPPALFLLSLLAVSTIFGLPGFILSAPLAVVIYVTVKYLYLRQT